MLAAFLTAAIPDPVTVAGVRLRPFSLGHLLLLQRWENSFVSDKPATVGDLIHGVIVCSNTFADAQRAMADPDLPKDLAIWGRKLFRRRQSFDFQNASALFAEYVAAGLQYPCVRMEMDGPPRSVGCAWPLLTLTALMAELGQSFDIAINQPLALSRWLVAANGERTGRVEVCDSANVSSLQAEADQIAAEVEAEEERILHGLS